MNKGYSLIDMVIFIVVMSILLTIFTPSVHDIKRMYDESNMTAIQKYVSLSETLVDLASDDANFISIVEQAEQAAVDIVHLEIVHDCSTMSTHTFKIGDISYTIGCTVVTSE